MICVIDGADALRFPFLFKAAQKICRNTIGHDIAGSMLPLLDIHSTIGRRAVHQFCLAEDDQVVGYQCLMSTLGPTLRSTAFEDLCEEDPPSAADLYELSFHCVDIARRDSRNALSAIAGEMIAGCIEWGLAHGINRILLETDLCWMLRAMQLRFLVRPLGPPKSVGSRQLLATELTFDWRTLAAIRDYRGDHGRVAHFDGLPSEPARRRTYAS
jgi:acyl-homoserine lactone synthase